MDIAAEAENRSGAAAKDRERFLSLVRAAHAVPEELREAQRNAA